MAQRRNDDTAAGLLRIALAYVHAYAGRFPQNVSTAHLKRFRKWRAADMEPCPICTHPDDECNR